MNQQQAHQEIELRFLATLRVTDFGRDDVDVPTHFVCQQGNVKRPHIAAFEAWVLEEIQTSKKLAEGRRLIRADDLL
ncbi:hypothetical protein [Loktanella sp. Alg231-35]|uniref:hypothetical protein n=1 Tax=Loktanella sp. Alg231-35 TaxID=1922220 RepID=UPI00190101ED|nr:hypothetical protein [Loktanella sp. Alg231-35]